MQSGITDNRFFEMLRTLKLFRTFGEFAKSCAIGSGTPEILFLEASKISSEENAVSRRGCFRSFMRSLIPFPLISHRTEREDWLLPMRDEEPGSRAGIEKRSGKPKSKMGSCCWPCALKKESPNWTEDFRYSSIFSLFLPCHPSYHQSKETTVRPGFLFPNYPCRLGNPVKSFNSTSQQKYFPR